MATSYTQIQAQAVDIDAIPLWASKAVWYQIFPERFCNGDTKNDPTRQSLIYAGPHDTSYAWHVSPWTSDWYLLQPWEKANGKDIWYNLTQRRYGGDIQGIINKLDYLRDLGITAIYLNPIFYAASAHKYDAICYQHVDPYFGPDPKGDLQLIQHENPSDPATWQWTAADELFLKLVDEVHKRNMRIILDGVWNHMSFYSFIMQDIVKNKQESPYKNWFTITDWKKPGKLGAPFTYKGWQNSSDLVELEENDAVKKYIYACTKRWMAPRGDVKQGIDGWRCDVAMDISHPFWKEWRKVVRTTNPDAYCVAEVWGTPQEERDYVKTGKEFDATMNYNFTKATEKFFISDTPIRPSDFNMALLELLYNYDKNMPVEMNFLGSHDTRRVATAIANPGIDMKRWGEYGKWKKDESMKLNTLAPTQAQRLTQANLVAFQMTFVGAPVIYYGDEAGMWGANDPDCRKPMVWDSMQYDDEKTRADQSAQVAQPVTFNKDLFVLYKQLIAIRTKYEVFQRGDYNAILMDDQHGVYAFERWLGQQHVIVVFNRSNTKQEISFEESMMHDKVKLTELMTHKKISPDNNRFDLSIPAQWFRIYLAEPAY